jgi:hypothetical protein
MMAVPKSRARAVETQVILGVDIQPEYPNLCSQA